MPPSGSPPWSANGARTPPCAPTPFTWSPGPPRPWMTCRGGVRGGRAGGGGPAPTRPRPPPQAPGRGGKGAGGGPGGGGGGGGRGGGGGGGGRPPPTPRPPAARPALP